MVISLTKAIIMEKNYFFVYTHAYFRLGRLLIFLSFFVISQNIESQNALDTQTIHSADYDLDGILDSEDIDDDDDGITDIVEDANLDNDFNPATNPTDTDGDGVPNYL